MVIPVDRKSLIASDFTRVSGVDRRSFGPHFHIFEQGILLVTGINETAAVGASNSIPFALLFDEYLHFIDSGFIIHFQAGIEIAFFCCLGWNTLSERLAQAQHRLPERLSLGILG